mmetsp:Transcript_44764/g.91361  ORF Transcript_44764/g.91361 Transcript_44764/m.91361 type:complete len:101 (-) Transcript_44764:1257-1559(-)
MHGMQCPVYQMHPLQCWFYEYLVSRGPQEKHAKACKNAFSSECSAGALRRAETCIGFRKTLPGQLPFCCCHACEGGDRKYHTRFIDRVYGNGFCSVFFAS